MVSELFKALKTDKISFLTAHTGRDFEDRIEEKLRNLGFTRRLRSDFSDSRFLDIKNFVLEKQREDFLPVLKQEQKRFIKQPFGSQQYPDFLVFTEKKVIPIEIKYSRGRQTSPVWNSNLPKANGFYIFGVSQLNDVTFFCGKDVLVMDRRNKLITFFDKLRKLQITFNKNLKLDDTEAAKKVRESNIRLTGFYPYVRIAYEQKSINNRSFNYFTNTTRRDIEMAAIKFAKELEK